MTYDMQKLDEIAKQLPDDMQDKGTLLGVVSEIREALGVGGKPMLSELPEIVKERCRKTITVNADDCICEEEWFCWCPICKKFCIPVSRYKDSSFVPVAAQR